MPNISRTSVFFIGSLSHSLKSAFFDRFKNAALIEPSPDLTQPLDTLVSCTFVAENKIVKSDVTKAEPSLSELTLDDQPRQTLKLTRSQQKPSLFSKRSIIQVELADGSVGRPDKRILLIAATSPQEHNQIVAEFANVHEDKFDASLYLVDPFFSKGRESIKYNTPFKDKKSTPFEHLDETADLAKMASKLCTHLETELVIKVGRRKVVEQKDIDSDAEEDANEYGANVSLSNL